MGKKMQVSWRLFMSFFVFLGLLGTLLWLVSGRPAQAMADQSQEASVSAPSATTADVWCVAGSFQSPATWQNDTDPLYDDGTHGDIVAGDGVFSLDYEIATAAQYEFKVFACGDWGTGFPYANSWLNTTAVNESVKFTFDTNNHSSDAGPALAPTQNIVNVWDGSSFIAVGDVIGWDETNAANALVDMGHGVYVFTATVPAAGAYAGKIVAANTWDAVTANGRIISGANPGNYGYSTTSDNQAVTFYLDTKSGRMGIFPQESTGGNWCVAGGFQSPSQWDNNDDPLYDDGTHGDLIGGDGVFSLDYTIATTGRFEMKVFTCNSWDPPSFPADNAWVVTTSDNQVVKFTFDTNDHSGDAGLALMPAQNIVNAWDSTPSAFTVVGPWQSWANPSVDTDMTAAGNKYHVVSANFATAGAYAAKLTETGSWDNQFAADGRRIGANSPSPVEFTVWNDGDDVQFYLDANQGRWAIIAPPSGGASQDGLIVMDALGHDSRDGQFRTPGGPVITGTAVTLRLRSAMNDLTGAKVRVYNDLTNAEFFLPMSIAASDGVYDWWQATIPATVDSTLFWYRFIAIDGSTTAYYEDDASRDGGWGKATTTSQDNSWQLTVFDPGFQTPDWVKNAVIYQIFPDRFRDGDTTNNPAPGRFFYDELDGTIFRSDPDGGTANPWNEVICDPRDAADCLGTYSLNFYGGDLKGVQDKLQYLKNLGVTTIYFNPIFESPSNHKYDTGNYYDIAADFGDLQSFITLTTEAHNLDMYVILDGVFNHTSSDSMFFDRYSRFDENGNLTSPGGPGVNDASGACESQTSPYRDWYYFTDVAAGTGDCVGSDGTPLAANYESWFGYDSLPKLNASDPGVRDMIFAGGADSVAVQWLQYADGWRFDVGGDIDPGHTNDPTNLFWEEFRETVRTKYPDTYMVIEEWGNASPWLLGKEMDATMNYQYGAAMLSFWRDTTFTDNDHNSGSSVGELKPLKPSELNGRLLNWIERYPPEALYAMMNLLDSHDTNRALFLLDDNAADANNDTLLQNPNYDWSNALARLRGVAILQMTLPGAPTIYYGDEVGLVGPTYFSGGKWEDDPYNRQPYPWLDQSGTPFYTFLQSQTHQDDMYDYYANLTSARNSHVALRLGSFDPLLIDDVNMIYAYGRKMADNNDAALVFVNRDGTLAVPIDHTVALTVAGYIPFGAEFTDVMSGASYTVDGSGVITVTVPGESGAVLVLDSVLAAPPNAVIDLAVTAEGNAQIDLGWTAVSGSVNVTYHVYRSLTSGGGYTLIGSTDSLSYSDTGLTNATTYYYMVVVENKDSGLLSENSNEVSGQPQHDLTTAWYNLQWPFEITHTISTITPTENIYGQIHIAGFTGPDGPAAGIRAQVGYGPVADAPSADSWSWTEMSYDSAQNNNDQYVGKLLPDTVGEFLFTTRWSSNNGQTWYYSVDKDAGFVGDLHVVASDDTAAPAATTLYLDGTTAGSISLSWDLNSESDLSGYELYRQNVAVPGFAKIATTAVITQYIDTDVTTGETYEYYIQAFDTSFNRSPASNHVEATAEARFVTVTFKVAVPEYTPGTVYIVGDQSEWGPWNPGKTPMTQVGSSNVWTYTTTILDGTQIQYKYTRGTWDKVESWGTIVSLNNRDLTISYGDDGTMLVDNTATDWGNGLDDEKAVQTWRDPIVLEYGPMGSGVSVGTAVTTTWSIVMDAGSEFEVVGPSGVVSGTFALTNDSHDLTFTPAESLAYSATYTVTVTGQVGSSSPGADSGTQQIPVQWQFETEPFTLWFPVMFKN